MKPSGGSDAVLVVERASPALEADGGHGAVEEAPLRPGKPAGRARAVRGTVDREHVRRRRRGRGARYDTGVGISAYEGAVPEKAQNAVGPQHADHGPFARGPGGIAVQPADTRQVAADLVVAAG